MMLKNRSLYLRNLEGQGEDILAFFSILVGYFRFLYKGDA